MAAASPHHLQTRALIRRLTRRDDPEPRRWAGLVSVWLHLGALAIGSTTAPLPSLGDPGAPHTVRIERMWTGPGAEGAGGQTGELSGAADGRAPRSSASARAEGAGQDRADGLQPSGSAPSGSAPSGSAPSGSAPSGSAPSGSAPSGSAPSGSHAPAPHAAPPGSPRPQAAPPRDRDNATAPPPPGGDDQPEELIAYVRTEASDAIAQAPAGVTTISARHTHAPVPVRAPVTSERSGPLRPLSEGVAHDGGQHSLDRREGTLDTSRGNRAVATILPQPVSAGGGGGGARGRGRSAGGAGAAGPRLEGGQAAAAASGASAAAGGGGAGIGPQPRAAQPAPLGTRPTPDAPGWWRPLAARVVEPRRPAPATQAASVAPATTRGVRRAVIERPGQRADLGGADTTPERGALPDPIAPAPGLGHPIAAPGTADPVEELREALGFGPVDREQLSARPAWAGPDGAHGRSDSSPQAVADVPIAWTTAVSTIGTPLGAWIQRCEALIAQRWRSRDLDPHARALGLQGQVTVRYVIQGTGRVSEAKVTRSSGNANLDQMALDAIPAKLPRLPRGLRSVPLHHQITLRYRNPLVTTGSEP